MPDVAHPFRNAAKTVATYALLLACLATTGCSAGHRAQPRYQLPDPPASDTAATKAHLDGPGAPIITLRRMVQPLLSSYSATACVNVMTPLRGAAGTDVATAASTTPDPVLGELVIDELHELAGLGSCPATASTDHLATVDRLLGQRLRQIGVSA